MVKKSGPGFALRLPTEVYDLPYDLKFKNPL